MVKGKPYISVNMAKIKAENAPSVRQSLLVCGLKKLNAKKMKTAAFMNTKPHNPYAGIDSDIDVTSSQFNPARVTNNASFFMPLMIIVVAMVVAMAAMHEYVNQWAEQQDEIGQGPQDMGTVFRPEKEASDAHK